MHDDDRLDKALRELQADKPSDDFNRRVVTHAVWGTPAVLRRRQTRPIALAAVAVVMSGAVVSWSLTSEPPSASGAEVEQLRAEVRALRDELQGLRGEARVMMVPGDASPDVFVDLRPSGGAPRRAAAFPAGLSRSGSFQPASYSH